MFLTPVADQSRLQALSPRTSQDFYPLSFMQELQRAGDSVAETECVMTRPGKGGRFDEERVFKRAEIILFLPIYGNVKNTQYCFRRNSDSRPGLAA